MAADTTGPTSDQLDHALAVAAAQTDPDALPVYFGVPLNRLLTIARGPINVAAGTLASWLLVHVHLFGLFHLQHDGLSASIAQGIVWLATAILTDRGIAQWVKGHHLDMQNKSQELAAALAPLPPATALPALADAIGGVQGHPEGDHYDEAAAEVEELPTSPDVERD